MARIYLEVPYREKDEAKRLGAKWDAVASSWYITDKRDTSAFKRWLNSGIQSQVNGYQKRDNHVSGNIYVFVAPEIHGWIPGFFVTRVKIGLTRKHPEERRQQIISNQPAHDIKIIKTIQVSDMATVETALHRRFKHRRVKLEKSREWFDLYPWELASLKWYLERYEKSKSLSPNFPVIKILVSLVLVFGFVCFIPAGMGFIQDLIQESSENIEQ